MHFPEPALIAMAGAAINGLTHAGVTATAVTTWLATRAAR